MVDRRRRTTVFASWTATELTLSLLVLCATVLWLRAEWSGSTPISATGERLWLALSSVFLASTLTLLLAWHAWIARGPRHQKPEAVPQAHWVEAIGEASFDAVFTADQAALIRSFSAGAERLFGYSADEILGRSIFQILSLAQSGDFDRGSFVERLQASGMGGIAIEMSGRKKCGETVDLEVRMSRLDPADGLVFLCVCREARQTETEGESAKEREDYLTATTALDLTGAAVAVLDRDGTLQRSNEVFRTITGQAVAGMRGRPIWELLPCEGKNGTVTDALNEAGSGNSPVDVETHSTENAPRMRWGFTRLKAGNGEALLAVGREVLEGAAAENRTGIDWMRSVAHHAALRFNQLLTTVVGYSELLLESVRNDDDPLRDGLQEIRDAGQKAARLSHELQRASGTSRAAPEPVDLAALLRHIAPEGPIQVVGETPVTDADRAALEQVFAYLMGLTPVGSPVRMTTAADAVVCEWSVREASVEEDSLELHAVRGLLAMIGGAIEVGNPPDRHVRVRIPLSENRDEVTEKGGSASAP